MESNKVRAFKMSQKQTVTMVNYMNDHRDFALGKFEGPTGRADHQKLWEELANILALHGPPKTLEQWKKAWKDLRGKARQKNARICADRVATGNKEGRTPMLSDMDNLILSIIGKQTSTPLMDVGANQVVDDAPQTINVDEDLIVEDIGETFNEVTVQCNQPIAEVHLRHPSEEALPCTSTSYGISHQRVQRKDKLGDIEEHLRSADSSRLKVFQAISDSLTSLKKGQAELLALERQRQEKDEADRIQRREFKKEFLRLEGERLQRQTEIVSILRDIATNRSQLVLGHGQVLQFPMEEM